MPFNSSGTYVQVTGATTAQPGDIIRSATWDNIFSDLGTSLTTIGQQLLQAPRTISSPGSISVTNTDLILLITASVPVITLPLSSARTFPVKIIGAATGIFSVNNSVLTPTGADKINGLNSVTLNNDYQVITLYPLSSGGYVVD